MDVLFKNIRRVIMKNIGFTLVELLIVITIIATLSGIGYAVFGNATRSARDAKRKADLEQIRTALEMFKADKGCYPPNDNSDINGINKTKFNSSYINPFPSDPKSPYKYWYQPLIWNSSCGGAGAYALCAYLENGTGTACGGIYCGPENTPTYICRYRVDNP